MSSVIWASVATLATLLVAALFVFTSDSTNAHPTMVENPTTTDLVSEPDVQKGLDFAAREVIRPLINTIILNTGSKFSTIPINVDFHKKGGTCQGYFRRSKEDKDTPEYDLMFRVFAPEGNTTHLLRYNETTGIVDVTQLDWVSDRFNDGVSGFKQGINGIINGATTAGTYMYNGVQYPSKALADAIVKSIDQTYARSIIKNGIQAVNQATSVVNSGFGYGVQQLKTNLKAAAEFLKSFSCVGGKFYIKLRELKGLETIRIDQFTIDKIDARSGKYYGAVRFSSSKVTMSAWTHIEASYSFLPSMQVETTLDVGVKGFSIGVAFEGNYTGCVPTSFELSAQQSGLLGISFDSLIIPPMTVPLGALTDSLLNKLTTAWATATTQAILKIFRNIRGIREKVTPPLVKLINGQLLEKLVFSNLRGPLAEIGRTVCPEIFSATEIFSGNCATELTKAECLATAVASELPVQARNLGPRNLKTNSETLYPPGCFRFGDHFRWNASPTSSKKCAKHGYWCVCKN